ncbi:PAS domain-containing protein [Piscinibacter defluvii]|uniref:PAS domain-containing protein n=1 Tax=Piscinibacter defluvii TaxID=1796922 RepID=UPI000FDEAE3A|nr:PAS domain-containing protein [Piscinibacter defluvii]
MNTRVDHPRRRLIGALGALVIVAIVLQAAYDIWRSREAAIAATLRELDAQARVLAEQTARTLQAADVVLRHLASLHRQGTLAAMDGDALHALLREQAIGLGQVAGLGVFDAQGRSRALSWVNPPPDWSFIGQRPDFQRLAGDPGREVYIGDAFRSRGDGVWFFPIARRLTRPDGGFDGLVTGRCRIDYFQDFYRSVQPDASTRIALARLEGPILARHPPLDSALGRPQPQAAALFASVAAGEAVPALMKSPLDGTERFGTLRLVPEYELVVIVSRDAAAALAPWRAQALGTAGRTLALAALATALLLLALRQFARVDAARRSLEESRERYALAVAGSDDGIWDWDLVAGIAYNSARGREIAGLQDAPEYLPIDEWKERLARTVHPDDLEARRHALAEHLAGRTPAYAVEFRVRRPEGDYRWIRVRGTCIRAPDGRPLRLAGSVSDIDARQRAEAALRRSEERYQLAVAGSNEGLWDWDLASDQLFLSPRAQQLMFLEVGEPLRPRDEWIARSTYHPEDIGGVRRALAEHLRGRTPHFVVEYRLQHHSGSWHWYRQRGVALRDAAGRPYRMAGSMEDITARKQAEAERERLEVQLRQAQKLEAIGTLAGGIAHDFNNILAAILGYGELAQKDAPAGSPLRRHLDAALAAALRAKSLVERILAFSRSGISERVPVHVQSVVQEALDGIAATLPPGVALQRRLAAGDAGVLGDPTQIHQVVLNLCANAVQAMRGQGRLEVALESVALAAPRVVATSTLPAGDYLRLQVRDSGEGIAPQVVERIFDPFFTTKEVGVGTGLGLSLVHGIVTDLGGGIGVESAPGAGTTMSVYLPRQGVVAPPQAAPADEAPPGAGETVLLVDDEEALVRLGEETLAALGYEPVGFTSSRAALAALREDPARFDVVLSDEAMPEMTGSELLVAIRQLRPELPVVLMSGHVSAALAARARAAGVVTVLNKPLVSADIARALASALRRPAPALHNEET